MPAARLRSGSATDVGRLRQANEDSSLVNDMVYAVADGMGGHRGGAVASQVALDVLGERYTEPSEDALMDAALDANDAVFQRAANGEVIVEDLGSTNGTYLNGDRVQGARPLRKGDRIQLGRTVLEAQ